MEMEILKEEKKLLQRREDLAFKIFLINSESDESEKERKKKELIKEYCKNIL